MEKELPDGWEWKKLGEIGEYINGRAFKPSEWAEIGKPIVRIQNLTDTSKPFNYFDGECEKKYHLKNGDILISWSASLGVFIWERGDALLNQHIFKAIPDVRFVDTKYFVYVVKTVIEKMARLTHGSTMKHIVKSDFNDTKIPIPPLETQKKIVAVLEKAEETKKLRAQADELTQQLIQSVFLEMFGDPETNPNSWDLVTLESVCEEIHRYPTFYGFEYVPNGVPVLKISNMNENGGFLEDLDVYDKITNEINNKYPRTIVDEGDIIFEARGTYIGKCALVPPILKGSNISPNTVRISPKRDLILPEYFIHLSFTKGWQTKIEKRVNYWKSGFGTIKTSDLKVIKIPLPPIHLQHRFVQIVKFTKSTQQAQQQSSQEINTLFNSLIQKAFTGELIS